MVHHFVPVDMPKDFFEKKPLSFFRLLYTTKYQKRYKQEYRNQENSCKPVAGKCSFIGYFRKKIVITD